MSRVLLVLTVVSLVAFSSCAKKPVGIVTKEMHYDAGGVSMNGYLAYDGDLQGMHPGVLVVHEWWGQNDYPRERARMLAKLGYVAFALDMYGNGKIAEHPDNAGKFAMEVMSHMDTAKARFLAAYDLLKQQPEVDSTRVAAIGYCFGGGVVLNMALMGVPLDGVVSFHGALPTKLPPEAQPDRARMLVCNGADDPFNPPATVGAFKNLMDSLKVNYQFIDYPGAKHAFTNPAADSLGKLFNLPLAYDAAADSGSWNAMQGFFKQIFVR
jgi:dienelactone hydrolase